MTGPAKFPVHDPALTTDAARAAVDGAQSAGLLHAPGWPSLLARVDALEQTLGTRHAPVRQSHSHVPDESNLDDGAMPGGEAEACEASALARARPDIALGLRVLMLRGSAPWAALASWPLEAAFRSNEADVLRATAPDSATVPDRPPVLQPDGTIDYRGHVSVILKATRRCNLRCGYCSDWRADGAPIPFAVWSRAFQQLFGSDRWSRIDMIWHGGEPTLLGRRGIVRLLMGQQHYARPGVRIANSMQTNATAMTPRMATFLAAFDFSVSVSLDGIGDIHDKRRPDRHGRGSYDRAVAGLQRLRGAGLDPAALVVVGPELIARGADDLLANLTDIGVRNAGLLLERPAHDSGPAEVPVPLPTFLGFLLDVHRVRLSGRYPWVTVREIDEPLTALRGGTPAHCELLGNCQGSVVSLEPDGRLSHCDKYLGDPEYELGTDLATAFKGPRIAALRKSDKVAKARLTGCRWHAMCRGWCPHERHLQERLTGQPARCCGLAPLFEGLSELEGAYGAEAIP